MNHLPGGDDDLFINQVANASNTRIVVDPDAFTLSEPKKTFRDWVKQKNRKILQAQTTMAAQHLFSDSFSVFS